MSPAPHSHLAFPDARAGDGPCTECGGHRDAEAHRDQPTRVMAVADIDAATWQRLAGQLFALRDLPRSAAATRMAIAAAVVEAGQRDHLRLAEQLAAMFDFPGPGEPAGVDLVEELDADRRAGRDL